MQPEGGITAAGKDVTVQSPAKINWTLRVVGRRADGFHEIESLVTAVTLYDELGFAARADGVLELSCVYEGPGRSASVPTDGRNLILRAATLLAERSGCKRGMSCGLVKRIPPGGGLGGGSSNAASTLMALNRLWALDWPADRLSGLGAELGSDVPFFLQGGSAVIRGRGERVQPASVPWQGWVVLLMPGWVVSTAEVYAAWGPGGDTAGGPVTGRPDGDRIGAAEWMAATFNMLEGPAMRVCPALRALVDGASVMAGRPVRMSGSGSTVFTAFDSRRQAERFAQLAGRTLGVQTAVVEPVEGASTR